MHTKQHISLVTFLRFDALVRLVRLQQSVRTGLHNERLQSENKLQTERRESK